MICDVDMDHRAGEYLGRFRKKAVDQRLPVSGALDLTYRCNLRCVHCYAGHLHGQTAAGAAELDTAELLGLVRQAADSGCLYLVLSGGEPLLRPDFATIYRECRRLGLVVTVFTNATLLRDEHVELFREHPPQKVDVSVYGATRETYERVTQVPGSYDRAVQGIETLAGAGIRIGLKTMILRRNVDEVLDMEAWATRLGARFRLDPLVTPRLDGGREPLDERVPPPLAAALEQSSPKRQRDLRSQLERYGGAGHWSQAYRCGAGVTHFHIDPQGWLRPCLVSRPLAFDAVSLGFGVAWKAAVEAVKALKAGEDRVCAHCPHSALCGYCPGLFDLETGDMERPPEYVCALGRSRGEGLEAASREENGDDA